MTPTVGERFGPYEILGRLGRGGMGLVYRAWDGRLHREVAVKLLRLDDSDAGWERPAPGLRERFLQEARAASALNHPNICTVFDIGEKDGAPYLVMELMEGETLQARIERSVVPVEEMVQYGVEIAGALGAAHARGIVHRDIKPANIFLVERASGGWQSKVLDFGLAKVDRPPGPGRPSPGQLTSYGATVGTVAYMSPEQARGEVLDARSDLFSLGVVLYEMATRRVPFPGSTNALAFDRLLNREPEPVRDWNDSVPRGLEKIIFRLLAKERGARYQTAAEVSEALGGWSAKGSGSRLKRARPAVVPLVRAADPVAREKRRVLRPSDGGAGGNAAASQRPSSSESNGSPAPLGPPALNGAGLPDAVNGVTPQRLVEAPGARTPDIDIAVAGQPGSREWPIEQAGDGRVEFEGVEFEGAARPSGRVARVRRRRLWLGGAAILAALAGILLLGPGRVLRAPALGPNDRLMVAAIENRTGEEALDGTVAEGLKIALEESPYPVLRGDDAYRSALRRVDGGPGQRATPVLARQAAQAAGAKAYLYGTVRTGSGDGAGYTLSVEVLDAVSNRRLAGVEESVAVREQILGAIDRVAAGLRAELEGRAGSRSAVPLAREATGNLDALHDYALGEAARLDGRTDEALAAFLAAVALDPKFLQAQMQLAWLYRWQHAETASAVAARLAEAATGATSDHAGLLAQYTYALNATGDLERASAVIRRFVALYPHDPEGARGLARVLRLQGRFGEALGVAQRAIAEDPYDGELYGQAEFSLIGMDRYDAVLALEQQSEQLALPHPGTVLTAAYLAAGERRAGDRGGGDQGGGESRLASAVERVTRPPRNLVSMAAYGLYLDNSGQLAAGERLWRAPVGERPGGGPAVGGAWLLAQGALDRALVGALAGAAAGERAGECGAALAMARAAESASQGMTTTFNAGTAAALCGDRALAESAIRTLNGDLPQASAVSGYYLPDLKAALALGERDPRAALDALKAAQPYDLISLTPYLRGLAHVELHETQLGIVDFQTVLGHRGIDVTGGSDVYPMAQIALARAFAESGDKANSARAYRRFLELWRGDPGERLRAEALAAVDR